MPDVDTRIGTLEVLAEENRNLIDVSIEARQVAARFQRLAEISMKGRLRRAESRIDHLDKRIRSIVKFEARRDAVRSKYVCHLEERIRNLESRAH